MKTIVSAANTNLSTNAGAVATTNTTSAGAAVTVEAANVASALPAVLPKVEVSDTSATLQFPAPTTTATGRVSVTGTAATNATGSTNKRPASLDLNKSTTAKKQRLVAPLTINSPDLNMKTLNTPDLENILLSGNLLQTPQPGLVFPTKVGPVTSEQEEFGKGFEEALQNLHTSKNSLAQLNTNTGSITATAVTVPPNTTTTTGGTGMSGGSFTYTNLENNFPVAIKDEPQNAPTSPTLSPIDMETQEKIKLERKRQRNRVAASKCRKRKLERISKLEDRVKTLKGENGDLALVVKNLKDHVAQLKQQVINHIESGCNIPSIYNGNALLQGK